MARRIAALRRVGRDTARVQWWTCDLPPLADILDTYEVERARIVRNMVTLSRRLGSVIMPTSPILAAARDSLFACLNLSGRFRAFIGRGGVMPAPAIDRSALTASGKDALIGQMLPQPRVRTAQDETQLDQLLACHQWLALGLEADPVPMLGKRDLAILDALDTRFICMNGQAFSRWTLSVQCDDSRFMAWARDHQVRGVLIRPDHFIAARLNASADLTVLENHSKDQPMLQSPVKAGPGSVELPRSQAPAVKAKDLLYVRFERPDLAKAEQYLGDFGLTLVSRTDNDLFLRGTGSRP